ncbi:MAG: SufD family Fe-S cluster assembly protein [Nevskiaceae bacterium]|nr:MAG: SufD family Fe-S cluster assembly protein [Nevskiaceae bacterium]TAM23152.1 MAG: SufD family Fe-S cluster assembly protein [Nevskiaceae bacterium]
MSFFETSRLALPADEQDRRQTALEQFAASGFPGPGLENWHYSDWTALAERDFPLATAAPAPSFTLDTVQPLPLLPVTTPTPCPAFALDALNLAFATEGVDKTLQGQAQRPFAIVQQVAGAQTMRHLRHRLALDVGASATVLLWDAPGTGDGETLLTAVLQLELAAGSRLRLICLQDADVAAIRALHLSAILAADAQLELIQLDFGGRRVRQELDIHLDAPGAVFRQAGLCALSGRSQVDQRSHVWHSAPGCESRSDARLIAAGKAKAVLNAKVQVQPGAAKTDSETRIASLLLSAGAEIDAKPELEIYADDVKCAHGASFGQLDEAAAFYLRSRGLSADEARQLLTLAFAQSVLDQLPLDGLRAWSEQKVRALLTEQAA